MAHSSGSNKGSEWQNAARGVCGGKMQQEKVLVTNVWNVLSLFLTLRVACYDITHNKNMLVIGNRI